MIKILLQLGRGKEEEGSSDRDAQKKNVGTYESSEYTVTMFLFASFVYH